VTVPPDDFAPEVPAARKLEFMQAICAEKGRVDGEFAWVDIRFDAVTIPDNAQTATDHHR
jgi:hypothetical protein